MWFEVMSRSFIAHSFVNFWNRAVHTRKGMREIATQPLNLLTELVVVGKPTCLPLKFGFNDAMHAAPVAQVKCTDENRLKKCITPSGLQYSGKRVKGQRWPAVFPGPLQEGRADRSEEGLGSRLTFGIFFMEIAKKPGVLVSICMKNDEVSISKTCVNFGRSYGNQGWAEEVENLIFVLKMSSFPVSESFKFVF